MKQMPPFQALLALSLGFVAVATLADPAWASDQSVAISGRSVAIAGHSVAISGHVEDALGHAIGGARVELDDSQGRVVARAIAAADGSFEFADLKPGAYAIVAIGEQFAPATVLAMVSEGAVSHPIVVLASRHPLDLPLSSPLSTRTRNPISAQTGTSAYLFDRQAIGGLPQGQQAPVNHVLLQAPGVVQDQYDQVHIRSDDKVQYRLNGLVLPDGVTGLADTLDTGILDRMTLLTGALPAQYGLRTSGVVDIQTKDGAFKNGGDAAIYGGSHGDIEPSFRYGGSSGPVDYYLSGSYVQNALGYNPPTPTEEVLHDQTQQGRGFAYLSDMLDPTTRASLILGSALEQFQVPDVAGASPSFNLAGSSQQTNPSSALNEVLSPHDNFGLLAVQRAIGAKGSWQAGLFSRYNTVDYQPDPVGDLLYLGVASTVLQSTLNSGFQADGTYDLGNSHTLGAGAYASFQNTQENNTARVFPTDSNGNQIGDQPISVTDDHFVAGQWYSLYAQDRWKALAPLTVNYGLRFDQITGYDLTNQLSPRLNLVYQPFDATAIHAGYARYFIPPSTEQIPQSSVDRFANTTNAGPSQTSSSVLPERDNLYDFGIQQDLLDKALTLGLDTYYKDAVDVLDTGQLGASPILSDFNYGHGTTYGVELSSSYARQSLSIYGNLAYSIATAQQVVSGQFNFPPDLLAYVATHPVYLDRDQGLTASAGMTYRWLKTDVTVDGIFGSGLSKGEWVGLSNAQSQGPYGQIDLGLKRSFAIPVVGPFGVRLAILNLLDDLYLIRSPIVPANYAPGTTPTPGSPVGLNAPAYATGRSYYVGIDKPF